MANGLEEFQKVLPSKEEMTKMKSQLIDELYNDTFISHYLKKNNLNASFIEENLILLLTMKEDNTPCLTCRGYNSCKLTPKGCRKSIYFEDDEYKLGYEKCGYYKDLERIIDGYKVRDYPDEWLKLGLNVIKPDSIDKVLSNRLLKISLEAKKGIYLRGKTGTGKSYLVAALANSLIKNHHMKGCYVNFRSYIENCKNSMKVESDFIERTIELFKTVDLLVLDDLGGEKISDWSIHNVLYEIINDRMHNHKLTLFTSMYSLTALLRLYGGPSERTARVIDCIRTLADEVELAGINYFKL